MAVEVRYHVIREGKEVAVYISKKEADAHDKMLDIAETLVEFIKQTETIRIEDDILDELCIYLSKNRDDVIKLLKGLELSPKASKRDASKKSAVSLKSAPQKTDLRQSKHPDEDNTAALERTTRSAVSGPAKKQRKSSLSGE